MRDLKVEENHLEARLKELFILSMEGDVHAYEDFLVLSSAFVKQYLHFIGKRQLSKENVEDLHQEIMLSIHQKKQTYQLDRPMLPWIYSITRYRYIDFYRSMKRSPKLEEFDERLNGSEKEVPMMNFSDILEHLTPKQVELLQLVKFEGASYAEAAQTLNMSVPSVKVGIHRILKSLKERMKR